jgi:transcriptional regulator with XRE-family HTH domain
MQADTPGDWYAEDKATLGDRMTAARERAGLTEAEVARRIGVRTRTVHQWENDMSEPRSNRLHLLSGVLGVSLMWLMTGQGDGVPPPDAPGAAGPRPDPQFAEDLGALRGDLMRMADRVQRIEMRMRAGAARL